MPLDEVLEREGYYNDWTHLDPEVFYSLTQISEYIKTKGFGVDVRLLIAQLAEHFGLKSTQIIDLANLLQQKFENLEGVTQSFTNNINSLVQQMEADKNAVIANVTVDSEVILARGGKATLGQRLDETTAQLEQTNTLNVKQFGVVGDGITDDTQAIQNAINASVGKRLLFDKPTNFYKISESLMIPSGVELIGLNKPTIKVGDNVYGETRIYVFNVDKATDVLIKGFVLDGNRTNQQSLHEWHHAIFLTETENVVIKDCYLHMFPGDGICLNGPGALVTLENTNKNTLIENNIISGNGRNGVSLIHCENVTISNNTIKGQHAYVSTLGSGIDIEPNYGGNPWTVKNVKIIDNTVTDNNVGVQLYGSPIPSITVLKDIVVTNNTITNNNHRTLPGESKDIPLYYLDETKFETGGIIIADNILGLSNNATKMHAIWSRDVNTTVNITNNVVKNVSQPFNFISSKQLIVTDNNISNFGSMEREEDSAIYLRGVSNSIFTNNVVYDGINKTATQRGFTVVATTDTDKNDNNVVKNNIFKQTSPDKELTLGIHWTSNNKGWNSSTGNIIEDNTIAGVENSDRGIRLLNIENENNTVGFNRINGKRYRFRDVPHLLPELKSSGTTDIDVAVSIPASGRWEYTLPYVTVNDKTHVILTMRSSTLGLRVTHYIQNNIVRLDVRNATNEEINTILRFNVMLYE